jgi:hypothetical protein
VKTAVDTSVLLDVLQGHPVFGAASKRALERAYDAGVLLACDVVWAELGAHFASEHAFAEAAGTLHLRFDPLLPKAAALAGRLWRESRRNARGSGVPRGRVVADFLIGAHARHQADALLTRDSGFYRQRFGELRVIDPTA